jgi:signal transduction histidine kinase
MSLRLRLTIIYTGLLSAVILMLGIVTYSMISVVMVNQRDSRLQRGASRIIENLRVDPNGNYEINRSTLEIDTAFEYQVFSLDGQLQINSEGGDRFTTAFDPEALALDQTMFSEVMIDEKSYRVLTVPLVVNGEDRGWLQIGMLMSALQYTQRVMMAVFVASSFFSIVVVAILSWVITGQALEPLSEISRITRDITRSNDLSKRIPVKASQNDEISDLVLTFNQTLVRLERLFNTQQRFLADVSHELRTPLTVIKGNVGLMRIMKTFDEESLQSIESEVDRLTRMVGDLLLISQAETGQLPLMKESVAIDDLLFEVSEEMKILSGGEHRIVIEKIEPAIIVGDRDRLKQVFLNLGSNAVKYSPEGTTIWLSLAVRGHWLQIKIQDEGYGIPKEEMGWLFERFYRSDKSRTRSTKDVGYGLGLPISYWIVRNHGGRIEVESEVNKGTTFTVWLPLSQVDIKTRPINK